MTHGYVADKRAIVKRLHRIEGQVRGIEKTFVVNHLGHYLLARRLLDRVIAAPQGRVVVLGSADERNAPPGGIQASAAAYAGLRLDFLFRPRGSFYQPGVGDARTYVLAGQL